MDLRGVSYYVKRKQGFPSIADLGVADIFLGGTGLSFKIKMSTTDVKDRQNFFKVDHVDVDVKNFNIKLKQSRHKTLFGLFKPIMLRVLRPALQKVLEKVIRDKVNEFDSIAYSIKLEADKAQNEVQDDPGKAPNVYNRYLTATRNYFMKTKKKAEAITSDKMVNIAMTQHDSIFPNIKLPGGISTKAAEYKELAAKGDKWESPIFGIGSAGKTTDLPGAAEVTRKDHSVTQGGIRGTENTGQIELMTERVKDEGALNAGQNYGTYDTGATGFSNQIDQAFSKETPSTTATAPGRTTLGSENPILDGSARAY
jgi:hypothetical protein